MTWSLYTFFKIWLLKHLILLVLYQGAAGGGGDGYPEKDSQSPGHQVESVLLKDVWISQE